MLAVVSVLASLFVVVAAARRIAVLDDLRSGRFEPGILDRLDDADGLVSASSIVFALVALALLVLVIVWTWRVARNVATLGRDQPRLEPGWAIAGWLIPVGNLVLPVLLLQDAWRGTDATTPRGDLRWRIGARSALVGWWWAMLVGAFVLFVPGSGGDADRPLADLDARVAADGVAIAGKLAAVAAAVLLVLVVRAFRRRLDATLAAQQTAWRAWTAVPATHPGSDAPGSDAPG